MPAARPAAGAGRPSVPWPDLAALMADAEGRATAKSPCPRGRTVC